MANIALSGGSLGRRRGIWILPQYCTKKPGGQLRQSAVGWRKGAVPGTLGTLNRAIRLPRTVQTPVDVPRSGREEAASRRRAPQRNILEAR